MSIQLLYTAAELVGVNPETKLILMALADGADRESHLTEPPLTRAAAWAGVSVERAAQLVDELIDARLLWRRERAGARPQLTVLPLRR